MVPRSLNAEELHQKTLSTGITKFRLTKNHFFASLFPNKSAGHRGTKSDNDLQNLRNIYVRNN